MIYFWVLVYLVLLILPLVLAHKVEPKSTKTHIYLGICFVGIMAFVVSSRFDRHSFLINHLGQYLFYLLYANSWVGWFGPAFFVLASLHTENKRDKKALRLLAYLLAGYFAFTVVAFVFLTGGLQELNNEPPKGVCLQTSQYSCSAAAMVNLLRLYKIQSTEREMARLAYTRKSLGTYDSGIFYGLIQKVGDRYEVHIRTGSLKELKTLGRPCLISIRWGFLINHSIVVKEFSNGNFQVIDPLRGERTLSSQELNEKWLKNMIFIVDKKK